MMFDKENTAMGMNQPTPSFGAAQKSDSFGFGTGQGAAAAKPRPTASSGASAPDLRRILTAARSADISIRVPAEKKLKLVEEQNLPLYLRGLCSALADQQCPADMRQLAGICLKNAMNAKSEQRQRRKRRENPYHTATYCLRLRSAQFICSPCTHLPPRRAHADLQQRWLMLPDQIRAGIRTMVLKLLGSSIKSIRSTAAVVVSKIASNEIPRGKWPNAVEQLVGAISKGSDVNLIQACFEALGYICEENAEHLEGKSSGILSAIAKGMNKGQTNAAVKLAATQALAGSLELAKPNFEQKKQRDMIMSMVCSAASSDDMRVRVASFQCFVEIASLYYEHLGAYISTLFNLTRGAILKAFQDQSEEVAQMAIEFWTTIAEEEFELLDDDDEGQGNSSKFGGFAAKAAPNLAPLLLQALTKQNEDVDDDTWGVAMAASHCLTNVALVVRNAIVPRVVPFVRSNLGNSNWRMKEAAALAFGCILDGPDKAKLQALVTKALPVLLRLVKDDNDVVKDTAAWTIGRICEFLPEVIEEATLRQMMTIFVEALSFTPKVACNVCWAIHNLAEAVESEDEAPTSPLSKYFQGLIKALLDTAGRSDTDGTNLTVNAYECINALVKTAACDAVVSIRKMVPAIVSRLQNTIRHNSAAGSREGQANFDTQALLCGTLMTCIQKIKANELPGALCDQLMQCFLAVLRSSSSACHEEAFLAIGVVATKTGSTFAKYMKAFIPCLFKGLSSVQSPEVCKYAVGVSADVVRALGVKIAPVCDNLVKHYLMLLQNQTVDRSVKPRVTMAIGDLALAIGGHFERYLKATMGMLSQMSQVKIEDADIDDLEFLDSLRESILGAFTAILQGLTDGKKQASFFPFVNVAFRLVQTVGADKKADASVLTGAIGVVGDLAQNFGSKIRAQLQHASIRTVVERGCAHKILSIRESAKWAKGQCQVALR